MLSFTTCMYPYVKKCNTTSVTHINKGYLSF